MAKGQTRRQKYVFDLPLRFREQLRMAKDDRGLTFRELSELTGVHISTICNMYYGRNGGLMSNWAILFTALEVEVGFRDTSTKKSLDIGPS